MSFTTIVEKVIIPWLQQKQGELAAASTITHHRDVYNPLINAFQDTTKNLSVRTQSIKKALETVFPDREGWVTFIEGSTENAEEIIQKSTVAPLEENVLQASCLVRLEFLIKKSMQEAKQFLLKKEALLVEMAQLDQELSILKKHKADGAITACSQKLDHARVQYGKIVNVEATLLEEIESHCNSIKDLYKKKNPNGISLDHPFLVYVHHIYKHQETLFNLLKTENDKLPIYLDCLDSKKHEFFQLIRESLLCYVAIAGDHSWEIKLEQEHTGATSSHHASIVKNTFEQGAPDKTTQNKIIITLDLLAGLHKLLAEMKTEEWDSSAVQAVLKSYEENAKRVRAQDVFSRLKHTTDDTVRGTKQRLEVLFENLAKASVYYFRVRTLPELEATSSAASDTLNDLLGRAFAYLGFSSQQSPAPPQPPVLPQSGERMSPSPTND